MFRTGGMVTVEESKERERQQREQEIIDAAELVSLQEVLATLPWTRLPRQEKIPAVPVKTADVQKAI